MADTKKLAEYIESAGKNIERIKICLLRHDKNPHDREFLNDIVKSVRSITNAAAPLGLRRTRALCQKLDELINLIREEKKELNQEVIIAISLCKDRLAQFILELDNQGREKANIKDVVDLIQKLVDGYKGLTTEPTGQETRPVKEEKKLPSPPEEASAQGPEMQLPSEFLSRLQEDISELRRLADGFANAPDKDKVINKCSALVEKMHAAAMEVKLPHLAGFYLQLIAELEMTGVDLSLGMEVSLDYIDRKIKSITGLFKEIKDTPEPPSPQNHAPEAPPAPPAASAEEPEEDSGPIAALSDSRSPLKKETAPPSPKKKESRRKKIIEIDGSFLEEEKASGDYDEELFQIFAQQLRENISQLQELTTNLTTATNKAAITEECSILVGKLQSSANYMGYERLAEYYLQWIAELEMVGVDLVMGADVSFDFMQDKIDRITELFPEAGQKTAAPKKMEAPVEAVPAKPAVQAPSAAPPATVAEAPPVSPKFDDMLEDEEEEPLAEGVEPIAGVFDEKTISSAAEAPGNIIAVTEKGEFVEALDERLETFFSDIAEPGKDTEGLEESFMAVAALSDIEEEEEDAPAVKAVTGLGDEEAPAAIVSLFGEEKEDIDFKSDLEDNLSSFFGETTAPEPIAKAPAVEKAPATSKVVEEMDEKLDSLFADMEEPGEGQELEVSFLQVAGAKEPDAGTREPAGEQVASLAEEFEPIAALYDEKIIESEKATVARLEKKTKVAAERKSRGDFIEALDEKLDNLFADMEELEGGERPVPPSLESPAITEEAPVEAVAPVAGEPEEDVEEEEVEEEWEALPGFEPIAGIFDEEEPGTMETPAGIAHEAAEPESDGLMDALEAKLDSFFTQPEAKKPLKPHEEAQAGDFDVLFAEPAGEDPDTETPAPEEEELDITFEIEEAAPEVAEAVPAGEEDFPEGMLTDEELLEEIKGPIVGRGITPEMRATLPELEITAETVKTIQKERRDKEELFNRLETALDREETHFADMDELFSDLEEFFSIEPPPQPEETAPERKELFQRLSSALQSLDKETAGRDVVPESLDEPADQLFDKLINALEMPSERAHATEIRQMDKVLEEILSSEPVEMRHARPPMGQIPKKLAASEIKRIINMDTAKVERLMHQVGELDASSSALKKLFTEMSDLHHHYLKADGLDKAELKPLKDLIFRLGDTNISLGRLSSDIREGVLNVRMIPISLLFDRYRDHVGDLTAGTGKQVEIEISGEDTELEKTVIDEISEPLTHIVTNAVEHGIEPVSVRKRLGKPETGTIRLHACHETNHIIIEVSDDGQGIDLNKVRSTALAKGLFTKDELDAMSEANLRRLILNPDFSTVAGKGKKTEDRGQGLHIARSGIEELKGVITVASEEGRGTTIRIRMPLNLLVVKALKVRAGREIMALPVSSIEEIMKIRTDVIREQDGGTAMSFNGETIPLFRLTEVFRIEPAPGEDERMIIVVIRADRKTIGLIVDETCGLEDVIIKPLGEFLRKESGFSGATIISDGNISLIPDIGELIRIAQTRQAEEKSVA